ncbi:MAG: hypothetical protein IJ333_02030 [Clostridia bacterium]|nr:hypothetical protein [Clostridia bacterium]
MNKRWYLRTDFKSGRVPYLLYLGCLLVLGFTTTPYVVGTVWYQERPPLFSINLYEYLMPVLAFCSSLIVAAVFRETYRVGVFKYLTALKPSLWQLLFKRLIALYLAVAVPLCLFLGAAFARMQNRFEYFSLEYAEKNSQEYGFPVPELSTVFPNILVQFLCAAAAFILIALALMALTGDGKVSLLVILTYGVAEYFGFRHFYGKYGIITSALAQFDQPEILFPGYTKTHIALSGVCLLLIVITTHKKLKLK